MAVLKTLCRFTLILLLAGALPAIAGPLPVWELESSGNRVLVMGSVHYLRASDYPLPEGLMSAYELADALVMEIDMDAMDPITAQATMTSLGMSNSSLRESLGDRDYARANAQATAIGMPLSMLDQFKPWFAALTITQLRMMQLGFDPSWGIETRLTAQAGSDGKPIAGLETLDAQLRMLDDLDETTQRVFLMQSLEDATELQDEIDSIVRAWRAGDVRALEQLMLEGFTDAPKLSEALLVKRNRNWVDQIARLRGEQRNYLVVVGAMHLVGDDSVLAMLKDRGVQSRQLDSRDLR